MPHKISIIDKDGNQSEITLPDFAMDTTQERLIKSVQALGKMDPKTAKAYENLIKETKNAITATEDASDQQKKDAKALQDTVQNVGDKQVNALRQFRTNFADRVGKDMRDTFTAGGNILTAAIKTATVGLAAGAGLLYKTFMDTSDAFRSLAQSGLGGAGASGTEAQDAVRSLALLGMSASEAAGLLTSFGRSSTVLGKANFSKFVSGIASAGSFAADLGLSLEEAAEYAAEEIEIRQRNSMGRLQLDAAQMQSIKDSIAQTQRFASVMGKSMKEINSETKAYLSENADINLLMMEMQGKGQTALLNQIKTLADMGSSVGGDYKTLLEGMMNAASKMHPMNDELMQNLASMGQTGVRLRNEAQRMHDSFRNGTFNAQETAGRFNRILQTIPESDRERFQSFRSANTSVTQFVSILANAGALSLEAQTTLAKAFDATAASQDPLVTSSARVQNALSQIGGAFEAFKIQIMGGLAGPITAFTNAFTDTRTIIDREIDSRIAAINEDKSLSAAEKKARIDELNKEKAASAAELAAEVKRINENKELSDKEKEAKIKELYVQRRGVTVIEALQNGLTSIADTFVRVFMGGSGINASAEEFSKILRDDLIPYVEDTANSIKTYLEGLTERPGGDTIGGKIKLMIGDFFKEALPSIASALADAAKATIIALWESPGVRGAVIDGIGLLFTAALVKSALAAGVSGLFSWVMGTKAAAAATTAAGAATGGGLLAATTGAYAASRASNLGRLSSGAQALKAIPGSGLAGRALTAAGGVGAGLMVGKDAFDVGRSLATGESVKGEDVGGVIGGVVGGAIGLLGGPVGVAIGASLGNMAGNWIGGFFDDDEAAAGGTEVAAATKEQLLQQEGLAAMAMDPEHIRAVSTALTEFNNTKVDQISTGLATFNPALATLFTTIESIRVAFVDNVNNRLQRLLNIITGLNVEGLKLPATTQHLGSLAAQITAMPIGKISSLATAFSALTTALKDFGDLTTSNFFGRMMDSFIGKQDETANIIKLLNNFSDPVTGVNSERLLQAAQATQAFNSAMSGLYAQQNIQRTNISRETYTPPAGESSRSNTATPPTTDSQRELVRALETLIGNADKTNALLRQIRENST